jgi:hypothetical protein
MGLIKLLPFNTMRFAYNTVTEGARRKKAIEDGRKAAGLDIKNYWTWTEDDHEREREAIKRIFRERGIKGGLCGSEQ